jgi:hypothetical protein
VETVGFAAISAARARVWLDRYGRSFCQQLQGRIELVARPATGIRLLIWVDKFLYSAARYGGSSMNAEAPATTDSLRPSLPAKDFQVSKRFYEQIGFKVDVEFADGGGAILRFGSSTFMMQPWGILVSCVVDAGGVRWQVIPARDERDALGAPQLCARTCRSRSPYFLAKAQRLRTLRHLQSASAFIAGTSSMCRRMIDRCGRVAAS